jgi:hypothetical protein
LGDEAEFSTLRIPLIWQNMYKLTLEKYTIFWIKLWNWKFCIHVAFVKKLLYHCSLKRLHILQTKKLKIPIFINSKTPPRPPKTIFIFNYPVHNYMEELTSILMKCYKYIYSSRTRFTMYLKNKRKNINITIEPSSEIRKTSFILLHMNCIWIEAYLIE